MCQLIGPASLQLEHWTGPEQKSMTYWVGICTLPMFLFLFAFNLKLNKYTSFHLASSFILILLMHSVHFTINCWKFQCTQIVPPTFCCYFDRSKIKAFAIILWTKLFVGQPTPPFIRSNGSTITCWSNQSFYPILKSLNSDVKEIGFKYHNTTTESAECSAKCRYLQDNESKGCHIT